MLFYAALGLASFPFLVAEQLRLANGAAPDEEFAGRYADLVAAILFPRLAPRATSARAGASKARAGSPPARR